MIIEALLDLLFNIFKLLTAMINIPQLPSKVMEILDTLFGYIQAGLSVLANFIDLDFALLLFGIVIAVDIGVSIYHFVMWVLKKIPMLGIK